MQAPGPKGLTDGGLPEHRSEHQHENPELGELEDVDSEASCAWGLSGETVYLYEEPFHNWRLYSQTSPKVNTATHSSSLMHAAKKLEW